MTIRKNIEFANYLFTSTRVFVEFFTHMHFDIMWEMRWRETPHVENVPLSLALTTITTGKVAMRCGRCVRETKVVVGMMFIIILFN